VSFHPNDVVRRGRAASYIVGAVMVYLLIAFFRAQVLRNQYWVLQSEENRLRQIPTAAPRGPILDRNNKPIAENVVGYSVTLLAQNVDTLRATLTRLRGTIQLTSKQFDDAIKRFRRTPPAHGNRPGRVVRRGIGARGASLTSESDHSAGAQAHLSRRRRSARSRMATKGRSARAAVSMAAAGQGRQSSASRIEK
jgi:cell division protein FtsI/penicillin-binding protein 2